MKKICKMLQKGTKPGSKCDSNQYEVIFVKGHQIGIGCYLVEYEMDWTNLMNLILDTFEKTSNDDKKLSQSLSQAIESRIDRRFMSASEADIKVEIEILDQDYFPLKQTKSLHVTFFDNFTTSLIFFIRRKQVMRSLKDASLQKLSELLQKKRRERLDSLELPLSLKSELLTESQNIWYQTQFSKNPQLVSDRMMFRRDCSWRAVQFLMM